MEDDHDHTVCAVSESVQIFTVPTLVGVFLRGAIPFMLHVALFVCSATSSS